MSRATTFYMFMMVLMGIGLWAILSLGSAYLVAPEDLAGTWKLTPGGSGGGGAAGPATLRVEQSGRYFELSPEGETRLDGRLTSETSDDNVLPPRKTLVIEGASGRVTAEGAAGSDDYLFTLPSAGAARVFRAHRTERTFPLTGPKIKAEPKPAPLPPAAAGSDHHA